MGNILDYIILKDGLPIYTKNADPKKGITGDQSALRCFLAFYQQSLLLLIR